MQQFLDCMAAAYCLLGAVGTASGSSDGSSDVGTPSEFASRQQRFSVLEVAMLPHPDGALASDERVERFLEEDPSLAAMVVTVGGLEPPIDVDDAGMPVADVNVATVPGTAPLYVAAVFGFRKVANMLVRMGAKVNAVDATAREYCLPNVRVRPPRARAVLVSRCTVPSCTRCATRV